MEADDKIILEIRELTKQAIQILIRLEEARPPSGEVFFDDLKLQKYLGVSQRTIDRHRAKNIIKSVKIGGCNYTAKSMVDSILNGYMK